jgi:hypothetical protein
MVILLLINSTVYVKFKIMKQVATQLFSYLIHVQQLSLGVKFFVIAAEYHWPIQCYDAG